MEIVITVVISMVVGAVIGGLTNSIAIYMLFRPYHVMKIGKWSLPFTPGLIPKRQPEMAEQLGQLVERQLFTIDSIQQKLLEPSFQQEIQDWIQVKVKEFIGSEKPLGEYIKAGHKIEEFIHQQLESKLEEWWENHRTKSLHEVIPVDPEFIENYTRQIASAIVKKGREFLFSLEGERFLAQFIQTGMEKQGALGSMLGIFISSDRLVEKARPAIVYWLEQPETELKIKVQLGLWGQELLEKKMESWVSIDQKETFFKMIREVAEEKLAISSWFEKPLSSILTPWEERILGTVPTVVQTLGEWIYKESPILFKQLKIADMVRDRVLAFPLEKLEQMVRELATRELKMITWLGAILGGIIGVFQALLLSFFLMG